LCLCGIFLRHKNGGGLASQALICRRFRHIQPERYVKLGQYSIENRF
jgi:hypothetical protein